MPAPGTREKILRTAERLFATVGIEGVSVRQINLAAGQRNPSATAYHFGSKDALLAAVLDLHRAGINQQRLALLADHQRVHGGRPASETPATSLFIGNLVDAVAGLLGAPLSAETRRELQRSGRRTA